MIFFIRRAVLVVCFLSGVSTPCIQGMLGEDGNAKQSWDGEPMRALSTCVEEGGLAKVKELMEQSNMQKIDSYYLGVALRSAAYYGHEEIVKYLAQDAPESAVDKGLACAAEYRKKSIVNSLWSKASGPGKSWAKFLLSE